MKQSKFTLEVVEFIPEQLDDGILYVSKKYSTAVHACACGCGEEVVTPLNPTDWIFKSEKAGPSLHPSVGNWSYKCQSHYFIRRGKVVWAGRWTSDQITKERARDLSSKYHHFEDVNRGKKKTGIGLLIKAKSVLRQWYRKFFKS
ncbi:MAG: DUF6527 family protein [Candidatus Berkelbacteria bacterium]|nr:DUF6527 family protein [Candidatus Berkelbacteria bacterium]